MKSEINKMQLPKTNAKDDLENISIESFKSLFDLKRFELRQENVKDKGVDFFIEIKVDNQYSNFRFAVQLKSTEKNELNKDGSLSFQIDTSNINYLLNNGMPAYYVLFVNETGKLYYESVGEFFNSIYNEKSDWNTQKTHTLRFKNALDASIINKIYQETLDKGLFLRGINESTYRGAFAGNPEDKIVIDSNLNVRSDSEIRNLIETGGFLLLNEARWKDIILIHKKASGNVAISARYNLILGIANYYTGDFITALSLLRNSNRAAKELPEELFNQLSFYYNTIKYSLGMISEHEFNSAMDKLKYTDDVGFYIQLIEAKNIYVSDLSDQSFETYKEKLNDIVNNLNASASIKLNAECDLIYYEGNQYNMDYFMQFSFVKAVEEATGPNLELRIDCAKLMIAKNSSWYSNLRKLVNKALEQNNYFVYYIATINEAKVIFEYMVITDFMGLKEPVPGIPQPPKPDKSIMLNDLIDKLNKSRNYFEQIGHIENTLASLHTLFEIYHYMQNGIKSNEIMVEMERLVTVYDFKEYQAKLDNLKNCGTTHESFISMIQTISSQVEKSKQEQADLIKQMKEMDENERLQNLKVEGKKYNIELWPMGYFEFPQDKKNEVYNILNVTEEVREQLDSLFGKIIPIVNIYYNEISVHGHVDGNAAYKGIESTRNMYRIRKAFFKNKFHRVEVKF